MLINYGKTALRHIWNNRFFSLLNLAGLSVGMAAFLLIAQFVRFEKSYDHQSPHARYIWRAFNETVNTDGEVVTQDANTHSALGPSLKNDLPGQVSDFCRLYNRGEERVEFLTDEQAQPQGLPGVWMTDPGFLRMFPQRFIAGNPQHCLEQPFSLVLTRQAATQLFGSPDAAMDRSLHAPGGPFAGQWQVTAVVEDPPLNTHLKFRALGSYATRYAQGHEDNWQSYWDYNYFQLEPNAQEARLRQQLNTYSEAFLKSEGIRLNMQALTDIHLHSNLTYEIEPNGSARTVHFLGWVAGLLLLIAFVNYVNLSTANNLRRNREVAVRRAIGASSKQLFLQFLMEGGLLNLAACLMAMMLVQAVMPQFSHWLQRPLHQTPGYDATFWYTCAALWLAGLLVACAWPAFIQSRLSAVSFLKNSFLKKTENTRLRHGLVVLQFVCSTALIAAVLIVQHQLLFLETHHKGLSLDQVVVLRAPNFNWRQDSLNRLKMAAFSDEARSLSALRSVAVSDAAPALGITALTGTSSPVYWAQKPPQGAGQSTIYFFNTEKDFFRTYNVRLLAGELPLANNPRAVYDHLVINQACLRMLGFPSAAAAVGQEVVFAGQELTRARVRAVVADFHIETLKEPVRPTIYYLHPQLTQGFISLKLGTSELPATLAELGHIWQKFFPDTSFDPIFADEKFAAQYRSERLLAEAFSLFAALAVFIACLGLLGLTAFTAEQRTKEIGIRKVLGASVAGITALLAKDFLRLVLLAILIATPLAWYFMNVWLADFAYRIELRWWMFALAGAVAVFIALLTVSFQSIKAALANPVKSLRSE